MADKCSTIQKHACFWAWNINWKFWNSTSQNAENLFKFFQKKGLTWKPKGDILSMLLRIVPKHETPAIWRDPKYRVAKSTGLWELNSRCLWESRMQRCMRRTQGLCWCSKALTRRRERANGTCKKVLDVLTNSKYMSKFKLVSCNRFYMESLILAQDERWRHA